MFPLLLSGGPARSSRLFKSLPDPYHRRLMTKPSDCPRTDRADDRLARLLDSPQLVQLVPRLAPEVLHDLIRQRGLEACVPLVAAATPRQLASVLDLDLWRPTPGGTERFDQRRFVSWLETLMAEGEEVAARVVCAMDRDLAVAGLSRHVRVFDPGVFQPTFSSDDDLEGAEFAPSDQAECEIGGYRVRARSPYAWDAIVRLLVTLADARSSTFHALI